MGIGFFNTLTCCTCCRMIIRGWGWGGVLTSLTSTSLTLRIMYTLCMLSYDHQGVGGCIKVLDEYFRYGTCTRCTCCHMGWGGVLTSLPSTSHALRNMYMLLTCCTCFLTRFCVVTADGARGFAASCTKDYHHKRFKMASINHKQNTFTKTYHFRGRL